MARILTLLLASAALAAFATGCGGDDDEPAGGGSAPAATEESAGGGVTVEMKDIAFAPKDVTVESGQKITWKNADSVEHNVVAREGADFESETLGEGGSYSFTAKKAGAIEYVCTLHPGMDGTVTVR